MHLLDDVHLLEIEVLAPPTASTFAHSIANLASYEHSDFGINSNSAWEYDRKPLLKENDGKIANFFGETCFESQVKSPNSSQWNIALLSVADLVQLAIRN